MIDAQMDFRDEIQSQQDLQSTWFAQYLTQIGWLGRLV